jgi:hypothetical protein
MLPTVCGDDALGGYVMRFERVEVGEVEQPAELFAGSALTAADVAVAFEPGEQPLGPPRVADQAGAVGELLLVAGNAVVLAALR